jgi:hypothetical protein
VSLESGPYRERYPAGGAIRVASERSLQAFAKNWTGHHPVLPEHLRHAGLRTTIQSVGFYHNGDALYRLTGVPDLYWHEACLEPDD